MTSARPDTRTHLVNTATSLFLNKSYGTISTSKICTAAEVNKGTFYHFFPSKAALLIATLEKYTGHTVAKLQEIQTENLPPEQKVRALFEVPTQINMQWQEDQDRMTGCLISNIGHELSTVDEQIRAATQKCITSLIAAVKPTVQEFSDKKGLDLPVDKATEQLVAMIQGGLTLAKVFNSTEHINTIADNAALTLSAMAPAKHAGAQLSV